MTRTAVVARLKSVVPSALFLFAASGVAVAGPINTNDLALYNAFATGATVHNFENIAGMTPLDLSSYANALNDSVAVPAAAQLGLDINGLLFHSGGGSFNNPTGNPGTPTALLSLLGGISGDAHSASNVVGSLDIVSQNLDLDDFIEIVFIDSLQSRVGVWLNPSLGGALVTPFDSTGNALESGVVGTAGNFVGFERATADIKFISIIGGAAGFTVDDLTYAGTTAPPSAVPEPASLTLLGLGLAGIAGGRWRQRRREHIGHRNER
jgi:PEP-CTERM motif